MPLILECLLYTTLPQFTSYYLPGMSIHVIVPFDVKYTGSMKNELRVFFVECCMFDEPHMYFLSFRTSDKPDQGHSVPQLVHRKLYRIVLFILTP